MRCSRYKRSGDAIFGLEVVEGNAFVMNYGTSVVDKTHFRPTLTNMQNFLDSGKTGVGKYDFPDGKDDGMRVNQLRNPASDITEIAEVAEKLQKMTEEAKTEYAESLKQQLKDAENNAKLSDPVNVPTDTGTINVTK